MSYILSISRQEGNTEQVYAKLDEYIKALAHDKASAEKLRETIKRYEEVEPYKNFEIHKVLH